MDKTSVNQILRRMEDDSELVAKIAAKEFGNGIVLNYEDWVEMKRATLAIIANVETLDSFFATFEKFGKEKVVSTDRIINSTVNV